MKVIVPTNTVPNCILIQDIIPSKGIIIVHKNQKPYGFVVFREKTQLFSLQTNTTEVTDICGYSIPDLLTNIKDKVSGNISLEYFETTNE